nr:sulfatase-like hydrolase/transferase [Pseudarcicella sp.]
IVKMIKDHGDWENTIVFFFSDHGQGMPRFKTNSSRLGSQIPLVVRFPEKYQHLINAQKGGIFEDVVTFEDLAPTLINIATTISKPQYMKGKAFLGEKIEKTKKSENVFWGTRDGTDEVIDLGRNIIKGDYSYTRVYYPHLPVLQQQSYYNRSDMLKEMRADLKNNELDSLQASIFKPRSVEYLFNRKTDAWETKNLATDIKYKKILAQFRDLNQQKILDYNDTGFMPEYIIANIDKKDTLLNWKKNNYKVKKYLKIAEMVGKGKAYLNKQLKLAANQDSLVRYWAVVGLRNQSAKDLRKESIDALYQNEKSLFVKLEIAEILRYQFGDFKAWEWLTDFVINNKNEYLERQAMMKLANDENLPVSTIEKLKLEKNNINKKFKNTDMAYPISAAIGTVLKLNVEDEAN